MARHARACSKLCFRQHSMYCVLGGSYSGSLSSTQYSQCCVVAQLAASAAPGHGGGLTPWVHWPCQESPCTLSVVMECFIQGSDPYAVHCRQR